MDGAKEVVIARDDATILQYSIMAPRLFSVSHENSGRGMPETQALVTDL